MPKVTKKERELEKLRKSNYYKFVYFICEKLIIWQFLIYLLFYFNNALVLQKTLIALVITFSISEGIKSIYVKKRPSHPLLGHKIDSSFPSSHSAVAFTLFFASLIFSSLNVLYSSILGLCAFLVATGRVLGGAHYRIDVSAGAFLALLCTYVVFLLNLSISLSL